MQRVTPNRTRHKHRRGACTRRGIGHADGDSGTIRVSGKPTMLRLILAATVLVAFGGCGRPAIAPTKHDDGNRQEEARPDAPGESATLSSDATEEDVKRLSS